MEEFQDYAYYYNSFYNDKDYRGEVNTVERLFRKWGGHEDQHYILNLGCGTGRHDIEFAKKGYSVTGIDLSPQMIEVAKRNSSRGGAVEYEVADIRKYTARRPYDIVTSLFHVMSYQNTNEDIVNAFYTAANAVRDDGIFVFDLWYGPGVLSDKPAVRFKVVEDNEHILYRIADPLMHIEENVVDVNYQVFIIDKKSGYVRMINEVHKMRYFFIPELKFYLQKAGFELLECLDSNTLLKTNFDSWTAICVARKHSLGV